MDHVTHATPLSGMVGRPKANTWYSLEPHKIWRRHSRDISGGVKFYSVSQKTPPTFLAVT